MKWSFLPKQWYFIIAITIFGQSLFGQTINTCNADFFDVGGAAGVYDVFAGGFAGNGDQEVTYCATSPTNQIIRAVFSQFTIKQTDTMYVYDGPNSSSPLIGAFGALSNINSSFYSSGQCLTFRFVSNPGTFSDAAFSTSSLVGGFADGWAAKISCGVKPSSLGVEICDNGIDDDADGLIDGQDVDCIGQGADPLDLDCQDALSYYFPPLWRLRPTADDPSTPQNETLQDSSIFNGPITFSISTLFPTANITITNLNGFSQNYSVNTGSILTVPISYASGFTQTSNSNTIENGKGILITADVPIFVNYRNDSEFNKLILTGKNSEGLGQSFFVASQTNVRVATPTTVTNREAHFVSVMATEDNTSVTFTYNNIISDGAAGTVSSPVTIMLNRGQSYLLRDPFQNATVSGLLVTSDKDIAVASGSMHSSQIRVDFSPKRDGGVDVLIPVKNLGTDHVVVGSLASPSQEYAIIVAVEDSTEIFIDGGVLPITTLNKGQFYQYK
nr:hypothetical protein [Saprospiraceae bacterium]